MAELHLLGKRELWIKNVKLRDVHLPSVAKVVAQVLGLRGKEVLVTDARENWLVLDVMRESMHSEQIVGKRRELLAGLSKVPGLTVTEDTYLHSEGILGFLSLDRDVAEQAIQESARIVQRVKQRIAKRCIVYPTGSELIRGQVQDTNTPIIAEMLGRHGYDVDISQAVEDDEDVIASKIRDAVDSGYGLVVLTGGVGAESKDRTVEGISKTDPHAATPYIVKYELGSGRHTKDGVKVAVGTIGETRIVALPGPTDEVRLALKPLVQGLSENFDKHELANKLAAVLRNRLRSKASKSPHKKRKASAT